MKDTKTKTLRSDLITVAVAALIGVALLGFVLEPSAEVTRRAPPISVWPVGAGAAMAAAPLDPESRVPPPLDADLDPSLAAHGGLEASPAVRPAPMPVAGLQVTATTLQGSMPRSFRAVAGEHGDALAATWARLFMWDADLRRDLWPGDTLVAAWEADESGAVTIAAAKLGSQRLRRELTAYRFQASGDAFPSYWAADGTEVAHRLVDSPIEGYEQVTSLLRDRPNHKGMDFMAPVGTPIVAPFAGRVTRINWNRAANGLCVELERADGTLAKFLHLDAVEVAVGAQLEKGQRLATSGNTGRSTGPHLHYQLDKGARVLDPVEVHGTTRRSLPAADREAFAAQVARLEAVLGRAARR